jgi:tryptophan-rich sensory protein
MDITSTSLRLFRNHWHLLPLALVPGAAGWAVSAAYPMRRDDGAEIPFRPPAWFFGAVWPNLYLAFGTAWFLAAAHNAGSPAKAALASVPYLACTALLAAWIPVRAPACRGRAEAAEAEYRVKRKHAFWLLLAAASAAALCTVMECQPAAARLLSLSLLCWLCVASAMSAWEFTAPEYHIRE